MLNKAILLALTFVLSTNAMHADPTKTAKSKISVREYIKQWGPLAQQNMSKYGIPASIIMAQGILESGYGNSKMATQANNHFGIKCLGWNGEGYYQASSSKSCFRKYDDIADCFSDHARILSTKDRYAFLFDLEITDYHSWAKGLKDAGYATNQAYDKLLVKMIESYKLYKLDGSSNRIERKAEKSKHVKLVLTPSPVFDQIDRITIDSAFLDVFVNTIEPELLIEAGDNELPTYSVSSEVKLKYVVAKYGDSYSSIAAKNNITVQDILHFNDLEFLERLSTGTPVYLEPKLKESTRKVCTLKSNQSLWIISQIYGIELNSLLKINKLKNADELKSGAEIWLR